MKTKDDKTSASATRVSAPRKAAAKKAPAKKAATGKASAGVARGKTASSSARAPRKGAAAKGAAKKASASGVRGAVRKTPVRVAPAKKVALTVDTHLPVPEKLAPIVLKLRNSVISALEEMKAKEIKEIDIRGRASFADLLVIASGTSTRHVKSLADEVVKFVKKAGMMPLGIEGQKEAEWVLVDLGDIVCHLMLPRIREFYALERLWSVGGDGEASND